MAPPAAAAAALAAPEGPLPPPAAAAASAAAASRGKGPHPRTTTSPGSHAKPPTVRRASWETSPKRRHLRAAVEGSTEEREENDADGDGEGEEEGESVSRASPLAPATAALLPSGLSDATDNGQLTDR